MNNVALAKSALKGLIPFQSGLRRLKRRFSPYQDNPANSAYCITNGLQQIAALRAEGIATTGDVLEFGTGWLPLIPLLFRMAGARSLILTDVDRLMDESTIARAKTLLAQRIDEIAIVLDQPAERLINKLQEPFEPQYLVPWRPDAHPAASVDLIVSRAVFEHVPEAALRHFLAQFHRILRPGGGMCHFVHNSDHWEHQDKNLSRLDFLRYEQGLRWRLASVNQQSFQNRLRHSDYVLLFRQIGFDVLRAEGEPDPVCLRDLETLTLARRYRGYAHDDLATLISLFVLRRRGEASDTRSA